MECHTLFFREQHIVPVIPELSSPHWSTPTTGWDRIPSAAKRSRRFSREITRMAHEGAVVAKFTLPKSNGSSHPLKRMAEIAV